MRGRDNDEKTPVFGMVERGGKVMAFVTPMSKCNHLPDHCGAHLAGEHRLQRMSIRSMTNSSLHANHYEHRRIKHAQKVYVMGDVHTQTIEGFGVWLKRGIGGVYHSVSRKYLQTYLNEYSFRYNRRDQGNLILLRILERVFEPGVVAARSTIFSKSPHVKGRVSPLVSWRIALGCLATLSPQK